MDKTATEMGEKLQAVTLAKSVVICLHYCYVHLHSVYRSNVEADLTIEKQWRTSLQVRTYYTAMQLNIFNIVLQASQ